MSSATITEYKSTTLVQHIADTINRSSEIKYCFILGAGASKSSGISTGYELSKTWFEDIKRIFPDYQSWVRDNKIDETNLSKHYSKIYKKRFEINPVQGYEFLQKEMVLSSPSFGYSILSQLLETQHNVVITTNFDSLVEDALFLYSKHKPLICGHESLSEFVQPSNVRPIIIKVHRDLLLNPKNEEEELLELEKGFANSLDRIFQGYIPIVIGYGGNDLSLMNYLNGCKSIKGIFWCRRTSDILSDEIKHLLENKKGKIFEIAGYDEIMFQIYAELFKDKELDKRVKTTAEKKAAEWTTQLVTLSKGFTDEESKESLNKITKDKKYKNWWDVDLAANAEEDIEKKNKIYLEGLKEFKGNGELYSNYASFLHGEKKDYDAAEKYYKTALELDPSQSFSYGNYANLLWLVRMDYDKAEKYYKMAMELDPSTANNYTNYAMFQHASRKNYDEAEKYYKKALELNPLSENSLVHYAIFLYVIRKNYNEAEKYFQKAIELNPLSANTFSNYAQLLIQLENKALAKSYLEKALSLEESKNSTTLRLELLMYCFANFYKDYPNAAKEIQKLLETGAKSPEWDFSINIQKAKEENHPEIDKVIEYAEKISGNKYK